MKTQHEFPEDWRKISNEEAISHIKYLLEHYKEYNIEKYGNTLGGMPINSTNSEYLRPVINIKAPTLVKGIGTKSKPYTIIYD